MTDDYGDDGGAYDFVWALRNQAMKLAGRKAGSKQTRKQASKRAGKQATERASDRASDPPTNPTQLNATQLNTGFRTRVWECESVRV